MMSFYWDGIFHLIANPWDDASTWFHASKTGGFPLCIQYSCVAFSLQSRMVFPHCRKTMVSHTVHGYMTSTLHTERPSIHSQHLCLAGQFLFMCPLFLQKLHLFAILFFCFVFIFPILQMWGMCPFEPHL